MVSNSNGVNFNVELKAAGLDEIQVSNSNGVNFNANGETNGFQTSIQFQTPTE